MPERVELGFRAFLDLHCKCTKPSNLNEVNDLPTGLQSKNMAAIGISIQ